VDGKDYTLKSFGIFLLAFSCVCGEVARRLSGCHYAACVW
jgi:hypothetical protein